MVLRLGRVWERDVVSNLISFEHYLASPAWTILTNSGIRVERDADEKVYLVPFINSYIIDRLDVSAEWTGSKDVEAARTCGGPERLSLFPAARLWD